MIEPVDRRCREVHAGSGTAYGLRRPLALGEGLTLHTLPEGYRVSQDDVLVEGTFATPLDAIVAALSWSGKARLGPMPEIRVPLPGGAMLVLTPAGHRDFVAPPDDDFDAVDLRGLVERQEG